METKLFTTSAQDAAFFAWAVLYPLDAKPLTIVEITIPHTLWNQLFRFTTDGKTTVAVDLSQLAAFNAESRIQIMDASPLP